MRVNIYAEELTHRVEIISKTVDGRVFTGLRFYLELPVTVGGRDGRHRSVAGPDVYPPITGYGAQVAGPFMHGKDDDDSAAVTFWGKHTLRHVLKKALKMLDKHYKVNKRSRSLRPVAQASPAKCKAVGMGSTPTAPTISQKATVQR